MTPFKFTDFEDLEIAGARIEIRNIAGGLRDAMDVEPIELHIGDEFDFSGRCVVRGIRIEPTDKEDLTGSQYRVAIADALRIVIVDPTLAQAEFERQAELLAQRDQIKGQQKAGTAPPWLGYDDLTVDEVVQRIDECDSSDADTINQLELYEQANGGRSKIVKAIAEWREAGK